MRRVYRPTLAGRIALGILGVALVLVGLFILAVASFADGSSGERVVTIVVAVLIAALGAVQLFLLRVRLVADDGGVEVVNYLSRLRYAWAEIDRFEVGFAYLGISLVPWTGPTIKVNAIQKSNLFHWLGREGRADRAVAELTSCWPTAVVRPCRRRRSSPTRRARRRRSGSRPGPPARRDTRGTP